MNYICDELNNLKSFFLEEMIIYNHNYVQKIQKTTILDAFLYRLLYAKNDNSHDIVVSQINKFRTENLTGKLSTVVSRESFTYRENMLTVDDYKNLFEKLEKYITKKHQHTREHIQRRIAVDGTHVNLLKKLANEGYRLNETGGSADALVIGVYDITYNNPLALEMVKHHNERQAFMDLNLKEYENTVFIFDKGFESDGMIEYMENRNFSYIFSLKKNSTLIGSTDDTTIVYNYNNKIYKLRVVKYIIEDDDYYLLTNLMDTTEYSIQILKNMYHERWTIEEYFKILKTILKGSNINEECEVNIIKTFYAQLIMSSLQSYILNLAYKHKILKDKQYVNKTVLMEGIFEKFIFDLLYFREFNLDYVKNFYAIYLVKRYDKYYIKKKAKREAIRPHKKWYFKRYTNDNRKNKKNKLSKKQLIKKENLIRIDKFKNFTDSQTDSYLTIAFT